MRGARVTLTDGERTTAWGWLLDPARDKARKQIMVQARRGKEMAVAIDWDSGARMRSKIGSDHEVVVLDMIQDARRKGKRIILEHGHPVGGLDLPSPRDLLLLTQNSDTVAAVGAHAELLRHTVRLPEWMTPGMARKFAGQFVPYVKKHETGQLKTREWIRAFNGITKKGGIVHEQRTQI